MRLTRSRLLALTATLFVAACGIDLVGTGAGLDGGTSDAEAPDGMAADSTSTDGEAPDTSFIDVAVPDDASDAGVDADASADADADSEAPDACAATCPATTVPDATFGPVLFGDGAASCPSGYTANDVIENPTAKAGSCACAAPNITADCNSGTVVSKDGNNGTDCTQNGSPLDLMEGACNTNNNYFATNYATFTSPTAKTATCTASGTPVAGQYDKTAHRVCSPNAGTCAGSLCGTTGAAFQVCVGSTVATSCPAGFPTKHVLGHDAQVSLTCADCQCTNPNATCAGTLTYYSNNNCAGAGKSIVANTCTDVNQDNFSSLKWVGTVAPGGTATTTPAPMASVTMPTTAIVCCAN